MVGLLRALEIKKLQIWFQLITLQLLITSESSVGYILKSASWSLIINQSLSTLSLKRLGLHASRFVI